MKPYLFYRFRARVRPAPTGSILISTRSSRSNWESDSLIATVSQGHDQDEILRVAQSESKTERTPKAAVQVAGIGEKAARQGATPDPNLPPMPE
jgi:hypothetical protein